MINLNYIKEIIIKKWLDVDMIKWILLDLYYKSNKIHFIFFQVDFSITYIEFNKISDNKLKD